MGFQPVSDAEILKTISRGERSSMARQPSPSVPPWLSGLVLALACVLNTGCHHYLGNHQPAAFRPSESRDEAIRKKAAADPFAAEGQPVPDAAPASQFRSTAR